jgi:phage terminase large subunit
MPHEFPIRHKSPVDVLLLYDDDINEGRAKLHGWQIELCERYANKVENSVNKLALVAANGSGKSQFFLAPSVVWTALECVESLSIVTTASGEQLDTQAQRYIKRLCEKINSLYSADLGMEVFEIKYRQIFNKVTGAYIDMFATDQPGKAEGRHPIAINRDMSIFVDEAKTVEDEIFKALDRCTGATRRVDISSPGDTSGYFFEICTHPETPYFIRKVPASECPHLDQREIDWKIKKYGLHDPYIRGSIFAEFTSTSDSVVITRTMLGDCKKYFAKEVLFGPIRAGLDLGGGGDESVMSVWQGNKQLALESFRNIDTNKTIDWAIGLIKHWKIDPENVWADEGGLGRGILDNMLRQGYKVKRVLNQIRAVDNTRYANRGTELWFNFKLFVENYLVRFLDNQTLFESQLTNRYFRIQKSSGKLMIEPKSEAKAKGHPSPDRADATVLAWSNIFYPCDEIINSLNPPKAETGIPRENLAGILRERRHKFLEQYQESEPGKLVNVRADGQLILDQHCGFRQSKILEHINGANSRLGKRRLMLNG